MSGDEKNVVSAQIMKDVMDKFLTLVQENNKNYSAMVGAVETLASNQINLTDKVEMLVRTIDDEQLGDIVTQTAEQTELTLEKFRVSVQRCALNDLDFMADLNKHLAYDTKPKDFADKLIKHLDKDYLAGNMREDFSALLGFVGVIRRRIFLIVFVLGVFFGPMYVFSNKDVIGFLLKLLVRG